MSHANHFSQHLGWKSREGSADRLFLKKHADTTDVFCLQEVWSASYAHLEGVSAGGVAINNKQILTQGLQKISEVLPGHDAFFRPHYGDHYGLLMMVNSKLKITEKGELFVYKSRGYVAEGDIGNHARNIQYITIQTPSNPITVINFHGLWNGEGKTDSEDRIQQTRNILNFTRTLTTEFVLCGDFNLLPDTKSIALFEQAGLRNLINEYAITSTRTSYYTKPEKHADYAFITQGLVLNEFKVLPDEVSDHAPLLIEIQ